MENLGTFILNHWQLWLALVVVLLLIFINEMLTQKKRAQEISPQMAVNKINHDSAKIFDLRDKDSFAKGHIVDAQLASADEFEQKKMEKFRNKPLILVCAQGLQSRQLAAKLRATGFEHVYVLQGGITAWQKADLPLVKD